ncbi:hypothetical protein [Streptomyces sp. NPDC049906]|uniref:hypothetical protein n=1 Tax=Streptomyces sp. NPDC049906 TaxID=3155656 RepID=UPI00342F0429
MNAFLSSVPLVIAGIAIAAAVTIVFRARERSRAWNSGLVAEARCPDVHTTRHRSDDRLRTARHFVFEFTPDEGRTVRFEEEDLPGTVLAGDVVPVTSGPVHDFRGKTTPSGDSSAKPPPTRARSRWSPHEGRSGHRPRGRPEGATPRAGH